MGGSSDKDVVEGLFAPYDAERILAMPLSWFPNDDNLMCRQGNKDLKHILFYCPFATAVRQEISKTSLHGSVNDFVALMQDDKRRHVLGMLMGIWFSRNMMLWKHNSMLADRLVHYVDKFLQCWKGARMVHSSQLVHRPVVDGGDVCW
ncbi:hypothetical protein Goklo_012726 [Gossypium klotzschianum]|uniref:Uncharacterized protein n=1 Tax=Gossypium klotzschianum TaxID=34286 RepID=A0A7J8VD73_9ROSI|nr:hypothetical protein [Gossypium klotzschianum]